MKGCVPVSVRPFRFPLRLPRFGCRFGFGCVSVALAKVVWFKSAVDRQNGNLTEEWGQENRIQGRWFLVFGCLGTKVILLSPFSCLGQFQFW